MPGGLRPWARATSKDAVFWTDVTQLVKTVAAAVIAWVIATSVLDLPQSFLAPWSALLVVHATVYRTFSQGARQVGAAVLGVLLAWAVGNTLGLDPTAVAVALTLGLVIGALPWFADETTTIAATALVVLTTGFSDNDSVLVSRLLDTGIGIAVGLLVNLTVWPPLRSRTAIAAMDAMDGRIGAAPGGHGRRAGGRVLRRGRRCLGRPHPRPRRGARQRLGAGPAGQGERPDEPAAVRQRAARPAAVVRPDAPHGAGAGRDPEHGADDGPRPGGRAGVGRRGARPVRRDPAPGRRRPSSQADPEGSTPTGSGSTSSSTTSRSRRWVRSCGRSTAG